jgi:VWFA-related protein
MYKPNRKTIECWGSWCLKCHSMTFVALLLLSPLLLVGKSIGQDNEAATVHTTASEVLLDFVVRDKNSKIIRDLRPEEVEIFEDGARQSLRHFEFYDGRAGAKAPMPLSAATPTAVNGGPTSAPAASITVNELRDISVVSVVIAGLDPRDHALTVEAMRQFVKNELNSKVYVGVFRLDRGGVHELQSYTNDGEKVTAAVVDAATSARTMRYPGIGLQTALDEESPMALPEGLYTGNPKSLTGPVAPYALPSDIMNLGWANAMEDVYQASISTIAPLHDLVGAQSNIPGRKVVLLFMGGLPMSLDTVEALQSVISAANRANVTIYAFNSSPFPYGLNDSGRAALQTAANASMQQQLAGATGGDQTITPTEAVALGVADNSIFANTAGNLADFTEATGGGLLRSSTDMRDQLHEAMEGVRTHYELTYAPVNTAMDGSFRKIEVKVTRPGARVFARSGYYAVPTIDGQQVYPFEIATLKVINTHPDLHQFAFQAAALQYRSGAVRNQFAFAFQVPTKTLTISEDKDWAKVHVCVTALIKDSRGEVVDKISKDIPYDLPIARKAEMQQGTVSFTAPFFLPPGHYTIDVASVDRNSMKASVSRSVLDVEQDSGFSISDIAVARRVDTLDGSGNPFNPLQARGATVTPELSNTVTPDASGALAFYAVAYPPTPADGPVSVSFEIDQEGKPVMRSRPSPIPLDASASASILAKFPAAKLTPGGHYEAQITFEYKGERLMKKVDFTLAAQSAASN